jgi:HAD superfamily hydrolase (TIGR01509 family)
MTIYFYEDTKTYQSYFDVDGLLIDSEPYWIKADADFFSKHKKKHTPEVNNKVRGMGHKEIMERWKKEYGFTGDTEALTAQRKALLYEHLLPEISLMEGAKELIARLKELKYPMAIATSGHGKEKVKDLLDTLTVGDAFTAIITADMVAKSKPAPDIFLKAASSLNLNPLDCLVFEDAPNGVRAGKAAGMTVFAVNSDSSWKQPLQEAGADKIFKSLAEITA